MDRFVHNFIQHHSKALPARISHSACGIGRLGHAPAQAHHPILIEEARRRYSVAKAEGQRLVRAGLLLSVMSISWWGPSCAGDVCLAGQLMPFVAPSSIRSRSTWLQWAMRAVVDALFMLVDTAFLQMLSSRRLMLQAQ